MDKPRLRVRQNRFMYVAIAPSGFIMPLAEYYAVMGRNAARAKAGA